VLPALLSILAVGGAAATRRVASELAAWFFAGSALFLGYAHYLVWVRRRGHGAARWILVVNTLLIGYLWYGRVHLWLERWLR